MTQMEYWHKQGVLVRVCVSLHCVQRYNDLMLVERVKDGIQDNIKMAEIFFFKAKIILRRHFYKTY